MLPKSKSINLKHQRLWLLPQKAVYWQKKKILLVADLHIGKSGHFRRNGIPVPQQVNTNNFEILDSLLRQIEIRHCVFLGDLFHSRINEEWKQFTEWRKKYPNIEVSLVIGNHDILPREQYHAAHLSVFQRLKIDPFLFVHDLKVLKNAQRNYLLYPMGGHIHPAVKIKGKGRQRMKFPCFNFGSEEGILPAFGQFTGTAIIEPERDDRTFMIVEEQVLTAI